VSTNDNNYAYALYNASSSLFYHCSCYAINAITWVDNCNSFGNLIELNDMNVILRLCGELNVGVDINSIKSRYTQSNILTCNNIKYLGMEDMIIVPVNIDLERGIICDFVYAYKFVDAYKFTDHYGL